MEKLPIYNASIEDSMDGIFAVSLVECPAVESEFLAFDKQQPKSFNFAIENEEKHDVLGVILRADYPIYRIGEQGEEYYIKFGKDVIVKMAEKMLTEHTFNNIDLNHDCCDIPNGVTLRQLFVKDVAKGVNPVGFEDIEDGSLFALYHIDSMELWNDIKAGKFKGFSIEAWLSLVKVEMQKQNNNNLNKNNSFFMSIKEKLAKLLATFNMVETDKGNLNWEGDTDLKEGDVVTTDNGDAVEDGEYTTQDGKVITVKDGAVESIKDSEAEVAPEETPEEMEEETPEETPETPEVEEPTEPEVNPEIEALKVEIEALKADMEAIKAKIEEIVTEPKTEPIEEEFESVKNKKTYTNKAAEYAKYLKN